MDMSKAVLPPRTGYYRPEDETHPLFPLYREYRTGMARLMVDSSDFADWKSAHVREMASTNAIKHPRYEEFRCWMVDNQAGRRKCQPTRANPGGLCFPANFMFWLQGGRW